MKTLIVWALSPNLFFLFFGSATMAVAQIGFGIGIPARQQAAKVVATPAQIEQTGETRIVTYPDDAKADMPDFRRAVVALNFGGPLAAKIKGVLMKKRGVRKFAEGANPCYLPGHALVCFSFGKPYHGDPFYSSASGSSYGGRGGYSGGASQNGAFVGTTIFAVLIAKDGTVTELGEAASSAFAGYSAGSSSSFGFRFNGSSSNYSRISTETAIAIAQEKAVSKFFDPRWWKKLDASTSVQWFPGAAMAVETAFGN